MSQCLAFLISRFGFHRTCHSKKADLMCSILHSSPWAGVVLAYSLRYPSPLTPHIVTVDVLSRDFDPKEGTLTTERIILKRGAASALPRWFPVKVLGRTESWVYEKSCIDLLRSSATVVTRNMDHRTVMDVQEDLHFHVDPADPQQSVWLAR